MRESRTRLDVRVAPEIATLLQEEATREHRSLNSLCAHVLAQHVEAVEARHTIVRHERAGLPVREATRKAIGG